MGRWNPDDRLKKIANEFEDIARRKRNAQQVQRVSKEIYEDITSTGLPNATVEDFGKRWLAQKKVEVSNGTYVFYDIGFRKFTKHLGAKSGSAFFEISKEDILRFRDAEAKKNSPSTVNHNLKFVRMLFNAARKEGLIADNSAEDVPILKRDSKSSRRPFTQAEVKLMLKVADDEWKSMILFDLYTGQRLGDVSTMKS